MKTLNILIADDHEIVREIIKNLLLEAFPKAEFGEAGSGAETVALVGGMRWDVLVLDIQMPGGNGLEVLQTLYRKQPDLPVLVVSGYPEDQMAMRALEAGAAGYLTKDTISKSIVPGVKEVLAGHKFISGTMGKKMAEALAVTVAKGPGNKAERTGPPRSSVGRETEAKQGPGKRKRN